MISNGVDHPGLLLLLYPRPVLVAAAVLDFFPIEGTHKTFRELSSLYERFHHGDRLALAEGYHAHQFSLENQEAALDFLDHFNGMPVRSGLPPVKKLEDQALLCTHDRTGDARLQRRTVADGCDPGLLQRTKAGPRQHVCPRIFWKGI